MSQINESLKAWRRVPSDQEWHELFHADSPDRKCPLCQEQQDDEEQE